MELCCNACTLGGVPFGTLPIADQITATKAAGFPSIGLDIKAIDAFVRDGGSIADIRDMLDASNLPAFEIHPLRTGVGIADAVSEMARVSAIGAKLGIEWICATTTGGEPEDAELIAQVRECAAICADHGLGLGIEFQPWLTIDSPARAKRLLDGVSAPNTGIIIDPFHFFRGADDLDELRAIKKEDIAFLQFCDGGTPVGTPFEDMGDRMLPGEGVFDLATFTDILRATGFDGVIECEVQSPILRKEPAPEIAERLYRTSAPYWMDAA